MGILQVAACRGGVVAAAVILLAASVVPAVTATCCDDTINCVGDCRQLCNEQAVGELAGAILKGLALSDGENITAPVVLATCTEDVLVRAVPLGVFGGRQIASEYFGFQNGNLGFTKLLRVLGGKPWGFSVQNQVAMAGITGGVLNPDTGLSTNVSGVMLLSLTDASKIKYISINYFRLAEAFRRIKLPESLAKHEVKKYARDFICNIHEQFCTGSLQQYSSHHDCLTSQITRPMLNANLDIGGNNTMCRLLHAQLLHGAPAVHCPHIGPSGGGACVNGLFDSPESFQLFPDGAFLAVNPATVPL